MAREEARRKKIGPPGAGGARIMIYLDNNASTRLDPEVRRRMEASADLYGNPSSAHAEGQRARRAVEEAREEVAALLGARPDEIFFTSGGTEANALGLFGGVGHRPGRVVVSAAEHPSVREAAARLGATGRVDVLTVAPDPSGKLDPQSILSAIGPGTLLVSVMAANNEYGGLFPIAEIAAQAGRQGVLVHTDAVQAAGRLPIDMRAWGVDLLSVSAHKFHGPKGTGALFVRKGVSIEPRTPGGGQEKRIRAGTENTVGIVGFGAAARLARERLQREVPAIARLRDRLEQGILESVPGVRVVGAASPRLPNTSAVLFEGTSGEALLIRLDLEGVAVSVGSACSSGSLAPSPAILSLGYTPEEAKGVVRFSLSRWTTSEEIDSVLAILPRLVAEARAPALVPEGPVPR